MKGLEKLTSIRLAEVLTQKGVIPPETITDALYAQDKHGDPFVDNLIAGGQISEWDLARVVVENFQLPFILASNYEVGDEAKAKIPEETLFATQIVPLDLFGDILTVVLPILTPYQTLAPIQKAHQITIYPYVGLISENKKVLGELYPDYKEWVKKSAKDKEEKATERTRSRGSEGASDGGGGDGDWMNIFDSADEAVRSSLASDKKKPD